MHHSAPRSHLRVPFHGLAALFATLVLHGPLTHAAELQWLRQFGTAEHELNPSIVVDNVGDAILVSSTHDNMGAMVGMHDIFLTGVDRLGAQTFQRAFGLQSQDVHPRDAWMLNPEQIFIAGITSGELEENNHGGSFLGSFSQSGNANWLDQYGSQPNGLMGITGSAALDAVWAVGSHGANVTVARYQFEGERQWYREFGAGGMSIYSSDVAADAAGNVVVVGDTFGALVGAHGGRSDVFLTKLDDKGDTLWTRQFGGIHFDEAGGVAFNSNGNIIVAGQVNRALGQSASGDAFLAMYDEQGTQQWYREFGSTQSDSVNAIALDSQGNIFAGGYTGGDLGGPHAGDGDAFLSKFDALGNHLWTQKFATSKSDVVEDIVIDDRGNIFVSGTTRGKLGETEFGFHDVWLAMLREPSIPGDTNGDGVVDLADLNNVRNHFGGTGLGDTNADGIVDLEDLNAVRNNFGNGVSASPVPEPSAVLLLLLGMLAVGMTVMRKRRSAQ